MTQYQLSPRTSKSCNFLQAVSSCLFPYPVIPEAQSTIFPTTQLNVLSTALLAVFRASGIRRDMRMDVRRSGFSVQSTLYLNLGKSRTSEPYFLACKTQELHSSITFSPVFWKCLSNKTPVRPGKRPTSENSSKSQSHHRDLKKNCWEAKSSGCCHFPPCGPWVLWGNPSKLYS